MSISEKHFRSSEDSPTSLTGEGNRHPSFSHPNLMHQMTINLHRAVRSISSPMQKLNIKALFHAWRSGLDKPHPFRWHSKAILHARGRSLDKPHPLRRHRKTLSHAWRSGLDEPHPIRWRSMPYGVFWIERFLLFFLVNWERTTFSIGAGRAVFSHLAAITQVWHSALFLWLLPITSLLLSPPLHQRLPPPKTAQNKKHCT